MEKNSWIPIAALIVAVIVPFANSLFQDWLRNRSARTASANPALNQPSALTQAGILPPASRVLTARGRWFVVFVQWIAGAVALMFMIAVWKTSPFTTTSRAYIAFAILLFVSVQGLPWLMHRPPRPPAIYKMFGLLWDADLNPLCPADHTLLSYYVTIPSSFSDVLRCGKCDKRFPIHHDTLGNLRLAQAKQIIQGEIRDA